MSSAIYVIWNSILSKCSPWHFCLLRACKCILTRGFKVVLKHNEAYYLSGNGTTVMIFRYDHHILNNVLRGNILQLSMDNCQQLRKLHWVLFCLHAHSKLWACHLLFEMSYQFSPVLLSIHHQTIFANHISPFYVLPWNNGTDIYSS